ncbi:MAG: SRPBCC domain-containing protein [Pirellulaceae bacterium]|nr:SRPBCC domain-containing protein [Planctomycetales bacterium]
MSTQDEFSLDICQSIEMSAAIGDAFRALLRRLTTDNSTPDNRPMPMVLEEWPGGRWFRDLGAGQGHLWGFVQVIKPPTLLELHGPMFMSYPVAGHIQFRLTPVAGGVELSLRHRVIGPVEEEHRVNVVPGWQHMLQQTKGLAERA